MDKIVMYGSKYCSDTTAAREAFSQNNIAYTFLDITEELSVLKMFLLYRDTRPEFDVVKENGGIGIPFVVLNDNERLILDINEKIIKVLCSAG